MTIDKNYLKNFTTLIFLCGEDYAYKIPVEEIAEINCTAADVPRKHRPGEYLPIWDGIIKLTPKGGEGQDDEVITTLIDIAPDDVSDCNFKRYISDIGDVHGIILEGKDGKREFSLPYDPLVESIYGQEIELSNCPSVEIDENGFITIYIGASSKAPQRVDNNYNELIECWKEIFEKFNPDILKGNISYITNFKKADNTHGLYVEFEVLNKKAKQQSLDLVFSDCENIVVKMYGNYFKNIELNMAKMANGRIFVDFSGGGLTFDCKSVKHESEAYFYFFD